MTAHQPISDLDLIKKHQEIEAFIAAEQAKFDEKMKPWKDKLDLIKKAFAERFEKRGSRNSKTEAGTAYKSTRLNPKVIDRNAFLKACLDNFQTWGSDMMNITPVTDEVKAYVEADPKNELPPGIDVNPMTTIVIRKA